jgi:CDP-diacylglycerol--serine O-phosphatidyltransferase
MTSDKSGDETPKEPKKIGAATAKLQELSFVRMIPNLATVAALCTGLSSIRFAMLGRFEWAVVAILIAAFLDGIDGRIARLLKATSDFGAELDSLSDFICFGVGPAVVIYMLTLKDLNGFGWGVSLFYSVCMGLRLARFNAMTIQQQREKVEEEDETLKQSPIIMAGKNKFFVGTPAPAAAFIALFPLMIHLAFDIKWILNPIIYSFFMILSAGLMVSRIPTYSFKSLKIPRSWVLPSLVIAALLMAMIISAPWLSACAIVTAYLITIPFSILDFRKLKALEAETRA